MGGRERGREGEREEGREGGREGERERKGGREGGRKRERVELAVCCDSHSSAANLRITDSPAFLAISFSHFFTRLTTRLVFIFSSIATIHDT